VGTYKIGGPRVLLLGEIPQNTHRNKKGVVYSIRVGEKSYI
jgi:hypothetical protein